MKKEVNRSNYFSMKHQYLLFYFALWVIRIISITFLAFILVMVCIYTLKSDINENFLNVYQMISKIAKIAMPIFIIIWISFKIILVTYKKKLKTLKEKLNIIDEI